MWASLRGGCSAWNHSHHDFLFSSHVVQQGVLSAPPSKQIQKVGSWSSPHLPPGPGHHHPLPGPLQSPHLWLSPSLGAPVFFPHTVLSEPSCPCSPLLRTFHSSHRPRRKAQVPLVMPKMLHDLPLSLPSLPPRLPLFMLPGRAGLLSSPHMPGRIQPPGLCTCCSSARNALPPVTRIAQSRVAFKSVLKYLLDQVSPGSRIEICAPPRLSPSPSWLIFLFLKKYVFY